MAKVDLEIVATVLSNEVADPTLAAHVVRLIAKAAERAAEEAAVGREPGPKMQWVVLLSDPHGELPDDLDLVGWVVQVPENVSPATAMPRIIKGAHHYNTTRRGRKHPAKSIAEACEVVGARFFKDEHVAIKTKLPVTVLVTDNELPADDSSRVSLDDLRRS